jgi:hypothetical protein
MGVSRKRGVFLEAQAEKPNPENTDKAADRHAVSRAMIRSPNPLVAARPRDSVMKNLPIPCPKPTSSLVVTMNRKQLNQPNSKVLIEKP